MKNCTGFCRFPTIAGCLPLSSDSSSLLQTSSKDRRQTGILEARFNELEGSPNLNDGPCVAHFVAISLAKQITVNILLVFTLFEYEKKSFIGISTTRHPEKTVQVETTTHKVASYR
ncbi:hypothetical protein HHI36_020719 [Cryptolaemus montrouzieri]|uniref:Uncharacterized protein n=1 Tax=Cryptolaemus montrouzieri TaxID=559131 RepID=A0ABD2NB62_9CUCU